MAAAALPLIGIIGGAIISMVLQPKVPKPPEPAPAPPPPPVAQAPDAPPAPKPEPSISPEDKMADEANRRRKLKRASSDATSVFGATEDSSSVSYKSLLGE